MKETQLEDAAVVVGELGQDHLHGVSPLLRRRRRRHRKGQVLVELRLGKPQPPAPEAAENRAGGGEKVSADGGRGGPFAEPGGRLQGYLLREILRVGAVADARVDE